MSIMPLSEFSGEKNESRENRVMRWRERYYRQESCIAALKARCDELLEAAKDILELYDDDIGLEAFPCATQVEIKSTTLGVLRNFRAAIANAEAPSCD